MPEIVPAIIAKSYKDLEEKVRAAEPFTDRIHLDIMDGNFVPEMTIDGVTELEKLKTNLAIEAHLMVNKPENHIPRWLDTKVDKIIVHWEATQKFQECVNLVKESDRLFGVAINPETPHELLKDFVDQIDFIQFMTVHPGAYGGQFVEDVLDKMSDFHFFYPDIPIQVDGGVNPDTAPKIIQAGASTLVSGSYIYQSDNIEEAINILKNIEA